MFLSVWPIQLRLIHVPIMFMAMIATALDPDAPLRQRRAAIRRDGEDMEMVELAWIAVQRRSKERWRYNWLPVAIVAEENAEAGSNNDNGPAGWRRTCLEASASEHE